MLTQPRELWALFLDVDGCLLDLRTTPGEVVAASEVIELLTRLDGAFGGAVALLSGRSIDDLDRLFRPLRLPCAGVHGCERRSASGERFDAPSDQAFLDRARPVLEDVARRNEGALLEDKGVALALHTRRAPKARREAATIVLSLADASAGRYRLQRGKEVFELKSAAANKGRALSEFMREPPFQGRRPVVTGDDLTDADSFRSAASLGGVSVAIGEDAPDAMFRLASPEECRRWLAASIA